MTNGLNKHVAEFGTFKRNIDHQEYEIQDDIDDYDMSIIKENLREFYTRNGFKFNESEFENFFQKYVH